GDRRWDGAAVAGGGPPEQPDAHEIVPVADALGTSHDLLRWVEHGMEYIHRLYRAAGSSGLCELTAPNGRHRDESHSSVQLHTDPLASREKPAQHAGT